ncbi:MAG: DUF167 domain-containing protein [Bacillota bacterium]|nr:DUF167 domain-containing protein [Bacillota bacterium]
MIKLSENDLGIKVDIKVQPRSSKNQIVGVQDGALKVKLMAPPVDGEANKALIKYFAELFKVPKSNVTVLKGESSRNKTVQIQGITKTEFIKKAGLN